MNIKDASAKIAAFFFGAIVALCVGILVIRHGVLVIAHLVPPLAAVILGVMCAALNIIKVAPALGWGVFIGALLIWAPIIIFNFFFPLIYVPVLAIYAILVPFTARMFQKMNSKLFGNANG